MTDCVQPCPCRYFVDIQKAQFEITIDDWIEENGIQIEIEEEEILETILEFKKTVNKSKNVKIIL